MAVLIFGASGSIGAFLFERLSEDGRMVYGTSRSTGTKLIHCDASDPSSLSNLLFLPPLQAVIWCQGVNSNDTVANVVLSEYLGVLTANVHFITASLHFLLEHGKLANGSRLLVLSSLWQEYTRDNKFSYTVSKSALGGLVRSCSVDLAAQNIFINALLPGPIDNEMTRRNLTAQQISTLPGFVALEDLYHLSRYLCFFNQSTNGQSLIVDLGFSVRKMG